jgi:hypothetical protein
MSTFNPTTGSVTEPFGNGTRTNGPPFTSQAQIDDYMRVLQTVSALKQKGIFHILKLTPDAKIESNNTGDNLPAVQVYNIEDPPIFAVVYTDINGNSSFSYKNDPTNLIKLIPNGSQILPTSGTALVCNYCGGRVDPGCPPSNISCAVTTQNKSGGILGVICSCLFLLLVAVMYLAFKKHN